jgi:hypothetical protein
MALSFSRVQALWQQKQLSKLPWRCEKRGRHWRSWKKPWLASRAWEPVPLFFWQEMSFKFFACSELLHHFGKFSIGHNPWMCAPSVWGQWQRGCQTGRMCIWKGMSLGFDGMLAADGRPAGSGVGGG